MDISSELAVKIGLGFIIFFFITRFMKKVDDEIFTEKNRFREIEEVSWAARSDIKLICYLLYGIILLLLWIGVMIAMITTK